MDDTLEDVESLENFESWKKIHSDSCSYAEKSDALWLCWCAIAAYFKTNTNLENLNHLIELTREHVVNPLWFRQSQALRERLGQNVLAVDKLNCFSNTKIPLEHLNQMIEHHPLDEEILIRMLSGLKILPTPKLIEMVSSSWGIDLCLEHIGVLVSREFFDFALNATDSVFKLLFHDHDKSKNFSESSNLLLFGVFFALCFKIDDCTRLSNILGTYLQVSDVLNLIDFLHEGISYENDIQQYFVNLFDSTDCFTTVPLNLSKYCMMMASKRDSDLDIDLKTRTIKTWLRSRLRSKEEETEDPNKMYLEHHDDFNLSFLSQLGYELYLDKGMSVRNTSLTLLIISINKNINELEIPEKDSVQRQLEEECMSKSFQLLADIMKDHLVFVRECILTAFSVFPTAQLLNRLSELAAESGFIASEIQEEVDSNVVPKKLESVVDMQTYFAEGMKEENFSKINGIFCQSLEFGFYNVAKSKLGYHGYKSDQNRNMDALHSINCRLLTEAQNYDPLSTPFPSLSSTSLGLDKSITEDLLTIIIAPRWHCLSWVLYWDELLVKCRQLLENPDIRQPIKELRYLKIDYSQFDDWSADEENVSNDEFEIPIQEYQEENDVQQNVNSALRAKTIFRDSSSDSGDDDYLPLNRLSGKRRKTNARKGYNVKKISNDISKVTRKQPNSVFGRHQINDRRRSRGRNMTNSRNIKHSNSYRGRKNNVFENSVMSEEDLSVEPPQRRPRRILGDNDNDENNLVMESVDIPTSKNDLLNGTSNPGEFEKMDPSVQDKDSP